jgi:hypothetical protein
VLTLVLPGAGCAGRGKGKPAFPVRGQVFYQGQPTPHAFLVFHPVGEEGPDAVRPVGYAAPDGTFTLTSYKENDGAPAGEYAVTVEWRGLPAREGEPGPNLLPDRYNRATTSGLRVRIVEGDNPLPPFQLTR